MSLKWPILIEADWFWKRVGLDNHSGLGPQTQIASSSGTSSGLCKTCQVAQIGSFIPNIILFMVMGLLAYKCFPTYIQSTITGEAWETDDMQDPAMRYIDMCYTQETEEYLHPVHMLSKC